jgi:folate-dependent phosphoribosylglycinamide formyltransferase PurN
MVIECRPQARTRREKHERRRGMLRRHGFVRTLNKLLYNWFRSRFSSRSEAITVRDSLFPAGSPVAFARDVPTQRVANINDAGCIELIRRQAPDLLAVCGTSVIRPEVFSLAPMGTINIHTGITPDYRSADPIFWALYHNEPEKVGVTIHFVDRGIDTGPIIHQDTVPVYAGDSLAMIYTRCVRRGAELFSRALVEIETGTLRTLGRQTARGRAFYSIDLGIVQYLRFRLRFRKLASRLPHEIVAPSSVKEAKQ